MRARPASYLPLSSSAFPPVPSDPGLQTQVFINSHFGISSYKDHLLFCSPFSRPSLSLFPFLSRPSLLTAVILALLAAAQRTSAVCSSNNTCAIALFCSFAGTRGQPARSLDQPTCPRIASALFVAPSRLSHPLPSLHLWRTSGALLAHLCASCASYASVHQRTVAVGGTWWPLHLIMISQTGMPEICLLSMS